MSNLVISTQNSITTETKIEYFVKYKKTGRQVKQVLYNKHLFGKINDSKWKCVSKKCSAVLNLNEPAKSLIRDSTTHQEGHEISEHEINFGRKANLVKFKIFNHIKNACCLYQRYKKVLESDGRDIQNYIPYFLLKDLLVNELSSKLSPKQEKEQKSSEIDDVCLPESVSTVDLKTKKPLENSEAIPKLEKNSNLIGSCYGCNQFGHKIESCPKVTGELKQIVLKKLKDEKQKKRLKLNLKNNK